MDEVAKLADRAFRARVSLSKVCKRAGVAPSTISRWRAGDCEPEDETLKRLNSALDELEAEAA